EREVEKTIACIDPAHTIVTRFFYNLRYPEGRVAAARGFKKLALLAARYPFLTLAALFPKQSNEFGFFIDKTARHLQPWIDPATGTMARDFTGLVGNRRRRSV